MDRRLGRFAQIMLTAGCLPLATLTLGEESLSVEALPETHLEQASGRQGVPFQWQLNDNQQTAIVTDNLLNGEVVTGNNYLSDSAFGNMQGIATVIQNTGNQVVIQDSTQINILINQ